MNSVDFSIENINEKELMDLIKMGKVNLATLKSSNMDTIENLNFLFLLDDITASELILYWDISRATVYRKIMKDHGFKIAQVREIDRNYKTIKLNPKDIFDNIYDYEEFLKWRATQTEKEKKTVLIKDVAEITGLTRKQIAKLIKKDKLVAIKKKSGIYEILKSSLMLYLLDYLIYENNRMEKAVEYLNINGNEVSLNMHLGWLSMPETKHSPKGHDLSHNETKHSPKGHDLSHNETKHSPEGHDLSHNETKRSPEGHELSQIKK